MKKVISALSFLALISLSFVSYSCSNDDDPTPAAPLEATTFKNLEATGAGNKYTLFNIASGAIVPNSDSASTKWDIGFRRTGLIFNSGSSGPGQAAVSLQKGTFAEITAVSDTMTFRQDAAPTMALTASSDKGWYSYNPATHIVSSVPGKVLIVKTADGKYAKIEILSYYKDAPATPDANSTAQYYTFRYVYQPDGSKKLQ